jgi:IS4 transposase
LLLEAGEDGRPSHRHTVAILLFSTVLKNLWVLRKETANVNVSRKGKVNRGLKE